MTKEQVNNGAIGTTRHQGVQTLLNLTRKARQKPKAREVTR